MTVCVAAIWPFRPFEIIAVCDMKLTFLGTSAEAAIKFERISHRWYALFAGNDVSAYRSIVQRFKSDMGWTHTGAPQIDMSLDQVRTAFCRAYQEELSRVAAEKVLATYGVSVDEFRTATWRERLGEKEFARKNEQIESVAFAPPSGDGPLQFLICGFDTLGVAHIFVVDHPGTAVPVLTPYFAIGSGSYTAMDWLANTREPLHRAPYFYRVCEAKFLSEHAEGIGERTHIAVISYDEPDRVLPFRHSQRLRESWKKAGYPIPSAGMDALNKGLDAMQTSDEVIAKLEDRFSKRPDPPHSP